MPIKSQAQRRKFAELLVMGKISNEVYERWNRGAGGKELPEHVKPKAKAKGNRKTTAKKGKSTRKRTSRANGATKKRSTSARKPKKRATRSR